MVVMCQFPKSFTPRRLPCIAVAMLLLTHCSFLTVLSMLFMCRHGAHTAYSSRTTQPRHMWRLQHTTDVPAGELSSLLLRCSCCTVGRALPAAADFVLHACCFCACSKEPVKSGARAVGTSRKRRRQVRGASVTSRSGNSAAAAVQAYTQVPHYLQLSLHVCFKPCVSADLLTSNPIKL